MSIIAWIVLGLIAGFLASKIVNRTGEGAILDILLGVAGALVGGWLFHVFGLRGVSGLNLYSMVVATIGAIVVLVVYHALFRSSRFRRF
ncbi:MAG: GlsB/YeaQ/YmgE family stress response membrane protein [Steroidobacteraceae bacterium]